MCEWKQAPGDNYSDIYDEKRELEEKGNVKKKKKVKKAGDLFFSSLFLGGEKIH